MKILSVLALVVVGCVHAPARFVLGPPSGALDGKTFQIAVGDGKTAQTDHLVFGMGQFQSVAGDDDNFKPAIYSVEKDGEVITFKAQSQSSTDGVRNWTGTVRGDAIAGTRVWIDKQGKSNEIAFRGKLVAAAPGHVADLENRR
jgi:hypothetical protein